MTDQAGRQTWRVDVEGYPLDLPIVPINPEFAISLMMVIDLGVTFGEHIGKELARKIAPLQPDIIVGPATLGIPVAIEVTRALGLDDYVVLQKSPKLHLGDALVQTLTSITSKGEQRILLDRAAIPLIEGKRVVVVDDVVASGSSLKGALDLVRQAGGTWWARASSSPRRRTGARRWAPMPRRWSRSRISRSLPPGRTGSGSRSPAPEGPLPRRSRSCREAAGTYRPAS